MGGRHQSGDWPETLTELVPNQLPTVPVDLFSNLEEQPLIYRVVDGRPLLYSVGPNRQDDGGTPPADGKPHWTAEDGDRVLLPPWEPAR